MKRVKSHAQWNKLSPQQLKQLDHWLFAEKLPYAKIFERAKAKLGFEGSESSVKRYSLRRQKELTFEKFEDLRDELVTLSEAPTDPKQIHAGSAKLMERYLFKRLQDAPDDVEQWGPVARLLMQNNFTEMLREAKANEHEIRREVMAFAKEKFEFDMMERALQALPQLRELAEARKDPQTKKADQKERFKQLRWMMFGDEEEDEKLQTPSPQAPEKLQNSNDELTKHE